MEGGGRRAEGNIVEGSGSGGGGGGGACAWGACVRVCVSGAGGLHRQLRRLKGAVPELVVVVIVVLCVEEWTPQPRWILPFLSGAVSAKTYHRVCGDGAVVMHRLCICDPTAVV